MMISDGIFSPMNLPALRRPSAWRTGPMATIIVLHLLLIYGLQTGLFRQVIQPMIQPAREQIFISLIAPTKAQQAQPSKTVDVVKTGSLKTRFEPLVELPPEPEAIALAVPPTSAIELTQPVATVLAAPVLAPIPEPRTISSGVEYLRQPRPEYPLSARRLREEGKILLRVLVNVEGFPEQAEIEKSSGFSRLDEAARRAVLAALFKPHREGGRPIAVYALIPISFQLET